MAKMKKGIAIILTACMIVGLFASYPNADKAKAANKESVTEIEGYTNWTFSTVGLTQENYTVTGTQTYSGADFSLDKSAFSGYVKFDQAGTVSVPLTQGGYKAPLVSLGSVTGQGFWNCDKQIIKFGLRTYTDGKHYLSCGVGLNTSNWWFMDDDIALDEEFLLQVTFDYVDKDSDGNKNDLVMSVWINGVAPKKVIVQHNNWAMGTAADLYVKDYVDATKPMRAYAALWGIPGTGTVWARSANLVPATEAEKNWTFSTLGFEGETIVATGQQLYKGSDLALEDSTFSGYVKFDQAGTTSVPLTQGGYKAPLISLGSVEGKGFWDCNNEIIKFGLRTYSDGKHYLSCGIGQNTSNWWFMDDDIALNEEIFLQVSFDYVDKDGDGKKNDLFLTVLINNAPAKRLIVQHKSWANGTADDLYVKDYVDPTKPMRAYAALWGTPGTGTVTARSAKENKEWTFSTLGFTDETIVATGSQLYKGADFALSDSKFSGYIKFDQAGTTSVPLTQGGYKAPLISLGSVEGKGFWDCNDKVIKFGLRTYSDGKHYLSCGVGTNNWWFMDDDIALNEEFLLQVEFDYVDKDGDGKRNDLFISVWINNSLAKTVIVQHNGWASGTAADLYVKDYVDSTKPMRAYAALWGIPGTGTVTARSFKFNDNTNPDEEEKPEIKEDEVLNPDLKKITFSKFRVPNGTYKMDTKTGLSFCSAYNGTLDGTVFDGNVFFSDQREVWFQYGANSGGWTGLRLRSNGDGTLVLHNAFDGMDIAKFNKDVAKVDKLTEKSINLKISVEFIDMEKDNDSDIDDVKLGIWFNDKLYNNEYFEVENLATKLGSTISCYISKDDSVFKVESADLNEKKEELNPSLKQITLKNFGIENGKYQYTEAGTKKVGYEANGGYAFSLDNTVCSMNIEFSSIRGADLRYGGSGSPWNGLRLDVLGKQLRICDAVKGDHMYYFDSGLAGVELLDNKINLKFSTEFVDSDGDGSKDDVKFGVWFNDVLYNNEYIYMVDYAVRMGSGFTILGVESAPESYIFVESDSNVITGIDFTIYGFTKNWNKELGEEL